MPAFTFLISCGDAALVSEVQALQVLDIDGEHKECLTSCIRLLLKVGRNKEALELADRAAALYHDDFSQLYLHALCLRYTPALVLHFAAGRCSDRC